MHAGCKKRELMRCGASECECALLWWSLTSSSCTHMLLQKLCACVCGCEVWQKEEENDERRLDVTWYSFAILNLVLSLSCLSSSLPTSFLPLLHWHAKKERRRRKKTRGRRHPLSERRQRTFSVLRLCCLPDRKREISSSFLSFLSWIWWLRDTNCRKKEKRKEEKKKERRRDHSMMMEWFQSRIPSSFFLSDSFSLVLSLTKRRDSREYGNLHAVKRKGKERGNRRNLKSFPFNCFNGRGKKEEERVIGPATLKLYLIPLSLSVSQYLWVFESV